MKNTILILLCVVCVLIPTIVYINAISKTIEMDAECIGYIEMAGNANSVELAEKHLTKGIEYLEKNDLTKGSTGLVRYTPRNDIWLWYENLKSAQAQLREMAAREELTELEESNTLMKLRETLLDSGKTVTHPSMISFFPHHESWFWWMIFIWVLYFGAVLLGAVCYATWDE